MWDNDDDVIELNTEEDVVDYINSSTSIEELEVLKYDLTHPEDD